MTLTFEPTKKPQIVDGRLLSLPTFRKVYEWPDGEIKKSLLQALTREQTIVELPEKIQQALFELGILTKALGNFPSTSLCWEHFRQGEFSECYFGGDAHGGFYAPKREVGERPCNGCLIRRYLAGRQASVELHTLLEQGLTLHFQSTDKPELEALKRAQLKTGCVVSFSGGEFIEETPLPVPGCPHCWQLEWTIRELQAGSFQPIRKCSSKGVLQVAQLPQLIWLCGYETVGGGAGWHEDPELARLKAKHEALERYAAHFELSDPVEVNRLGDTREGSTERTYLTRPGSVSTGLACRRTLDEALNDGVKEVCERDALARFWLAIDSGREVGETLDVIREADHEVELLAVPSRGWPTVVALGKSSEGRRFFGSACADLETAKAKALAEARHNLSSLTGANLEPCTRMPESFQDHALYYWNRPELFPTWARQSEHKVTRLDQSEVWWTDITPPDIRLLQRFVVRVQVENCLYTPSAHSDWGEILDPGLEPPSRPHPFA